MDFKNQIPLENFVEKGEGEIADLINFSFFHNDFLGFFLRCLKTSIYEGKGLTND